MPHVNPDMILRRMRTDLDSDWPARLLAKLESVPVVGEEWLNLMSVPPPRTRVLTETERRTLEAISRGLTCKMAADLFGVSPETIKSRIATARYKLRAKTTAHACCEAIRGGLIL